MGVIVTDKYDGWYTLIINEYYLHGDGKNVAEIAELVYAPETDQTANGYIDWTSLRVVDQSFRIQKNIETYNKGEKAEHSAWDRFTIEKLSHGAIAMDFKFQGEGEFKFAINNYEKNVIEEVTISGSEDNLVASRGKLEEGIDGWTTYTINFSDFNGDISQWDVSNVEDMSNMFEGSKFNGNISKWDVSNVTDMSKMFRKSVFNGDISQWNVSKVFDMSNMFEAAKFNGNISGWNVSNVRFMSEMFKDSKFDGDISHWDFSNLLNHDNLF